MSYDDKTGALVNQERFAAPRMRRVADATRYTHTDERTHAKRYYERDGHGHEVYATYYNSDDDPTFQARYNTDGRRAFVTSTEFRVVTNPAMRHAAPQHQSRTRAPQPAVVEEEEARTRRGSAHATPMAQPIVEEPDDDGYDYMERARQPRRAREHEVSPFSQLGHQRHHHRYPAPSSPWDEDAGEMYPLDRTSRSAAMPHLFMDDFFAGPRDPFEMMNVMRQQMSRQRAAMFGGVDPFANFF